MKHLLPAIAIVLLAASNALPSQDVADLFLQQPASPFHETPSGTADVDHHNEEQVVLYTLLIEIDPQGTPMGAYEFELSTNDPTFMVTGIAAGEHEAYHEPPLYDRQAYLQGAERIIFGQYAPAEYRDEALPAERVLVCELDVSCNRPTDGRDPDIQLDFIVGDSDGNPIDGATIHYQFIQSSSSTQ